MPSFSAWFVLTPFGLTSLALLLLTVAFVVFLAQSQRTAAGRWMLAHEVSLSAFLAANLALNSTFQPGWYPIEYLSFVVGMACLLQFALAFPHPQPDTGPARRMRALSIVAVLIEVALAVPFWLSPQTDRAVLLRTMGTAMGLWQSLAALIVLAYRTVELETSGTRRVSRLRALVRPQQPEARAAHAMLLATLSIALLAAALLVYRVWFTRVISETLFNIAWSIGLMLMLSAFTVRYLVYSPEPISFRAKLTLSMLAAVLTSVWLLSLVYPFQAEAAYDAARRADVDSVQWELTRTSGTTPPERWAAAIPDAVTLIAACPPGVIGAARPLWVRNDTVDLSGLCGSRFLINNTFGTEHLDTLNVVYRFEQAGQTYLVGFAYAAYLAVLNQFTVPIALVMLGSTVIIMALLPLAFYQNLIRPLGALLAGVQQVDQGRLEVAVAVQSNDEIGVLTQSFNAMALDLRTSVVKLENQVTEYMKAERAVREQREQLRALTLRLAEVEEIERGKLGRELHDQAGQNLTALSLTLKVVQTQLAAESLDPATLDQVLLRLADAADLVRQTTQRIRNVMDDLQPPALDEFGLAAALRWSAASFTARTAVAVEVHSSDPAPRLPRPIEVALFRIAQEALINVARHAQATRVEIQICGEAGGVRLLIGDNGVGFDVNRLVPLPDGERSRWGLRIMAERAEAVGGLFRVDSTPGHGTHILVEVKA